MSTFTLQAQALTAESFAPFGQVVGLSNDNSAYSSRSINHGNVMRYDIVNDLQLSAKEGRPALAIFRAQARQFPHTVTEMERHALGSQTFIPLGTQRFVIVVAQPSSAANANDLHAFITDGTQGIVLAPGTWHHALLAIEGGDFAVIERVADTVDCEFLPMVNNVQLVLQ
jgi:ureidoglycolate lyase